MVSLAGKRSAGSVQGRAAGDLCLRVLGSTHDGQIVRLAPLKCTIGSAPGCTLRLCARGIGPLECLILRGTRGIVARSWATGTRLNGHTFDDAPLVAGDRLAIGPVEFEVLPVEVVETPTLEINNQPAAQEAPAARAPAQSLERARVARGRVRDLIATVRAQREQLARLREEAVQHELASPEPAAPLDGQSADFQRRQEEWEAARREIESRLEARGRQLDEDCAQLEAARQAIDDQRQRWEQCVETTRLEAAPSPGSDPVDEPMRLARDSFEQQRAAWMLENARVRQELETECAELADEREKVQNLLKDAEQLRSHSQTEFAARLAQLDQEQSAWSQWRAGEESRLADLQNALDRELAEIRHHQASFGGSDELARRQNDEQANRLTAAWQHLDAQQADLKRRVDRQAAAESQRAAEVAERASQLDAAEQALRDREAAMAGRLAGIADLDQRRAQFEAERAAAQAELDAHQTTMARQREESQRAAAEIEKQRQELLATHSELAAAQAQIAQAQAANETGARELTDERADFEARYVVAYRQLEEQAIALERRRDAQQALEDERQRTIAGIDALRAEIDAKQTALKQREIALLETQVAAENALRDHDRVRAELERQSATARAELETQRAALQQETQKRATELQGRAAELDARGAEIQQRSVELQQRCADLERIKREMAAKHSQQQEQLAQLDAELCEREKRVAAGTAALQSGGASQSAAQLPESTAALEKQKETLEAQRVELARLGHELKRQHEDFEAERTRTTQQLTQQAADLESQRDELLNQRAAFRARRDAWEAEVEAQAEAQAAQSVEAPSPADEPADALPDETPVERSAGEDSQVEAEADQPQEEPVQEEPSDEIEQEDDEPAVPASVNSEDQTIEEYMAALIKRSRSGAATEPETKPAPSHRRRSDSRSQQTGAPREAVKPAAHEPAPESTPGRRSGDQLSMLDPDRVPAALERRSTPGPETDLAAMRELANTHAHIAITVHGKRRLIQKSMISWGASLACFVVTLSVFIWAPPEDGVIRTAAMGGIVAGVYWMLSALTAAGQMVVLGKPRKAPTPPAKKPGAKEAS